MKDAIPQHAARRAAEQVLRRTSRRRCSTSRRWACPPSTTATTSARWRRDEGVTNAFDFPGFVPAYIRPLFCRRQGPVPLGRAVGRPGGHLQDRCEDQGTHSRTTRTCTAGSTWRGERIAFQGLPARICWLGLGERHAAGPAPSTRWSQTGELKAPIVIGRDHLDTGSVASPNRETEAMRDGTDAVTDWPLLNALLNTRRRRDLGQSLHHGGGVGHGLLAARRHGHRLPTAPTPPPSASAACSGTTRRRA